ncbi:MAG: hypothetical protein ACOYJD_07575 [Christensenellales bacterium]
MGLYVWDGWFESDIPEGLHIVSDDHYISILGGRSDSNAALQISCHEMSGVSIAPEQMMADELGEAADTAGFRIVSKMQVGEIDGAVCVSAEAKKGAMRAKMWAVGEQDWFILMTLTYNRNSTDIDAAVSIVEGLKLLR